SIREMLDVVKTSEKRLESLKEEYRAKIFDEVRALDIALGADSVKEAPPRLLAQKWHGKEPIGTLALAEAKRTEKDKIYLIERYERRVENERKEISQHMVEVHKKFSIPVACLVFAFIGAPLGIMARRGGI